MQETRGFTRSEAERILRRLLRDAGLPQPIANHRIGRYEADLAWPAYRLIVEFDSWSRHGQRPAFGPDRRRGSELTAQGWSLMHVTWDDLKKDPLGVVARVAGALAVRA